jgi:hypothetical protein
VACAGGLNWRISVQSVDTIADCLVRHYNPAFSQKIFNIAEAQRETVVELHGVAGDLGWKAETWVSEG